MAQEGKEVGSVKLPGAFGYWFIRKHVYLSGGGGNTVKFLLIYDISDFHMNSRFSVLPY